MGSALDGRSALLEDVCARAVRYLAGLGDRAVCPDTAEQVAGVAGADSWATDAHKWLNTREAGFGVLNDVVLNQVVVDFGDADRTRSVIAAIQDEGTCWCGPANWHERTAMRVSVSGWATTAHDIDKSIAAIRRAASHLAPAAPPVPVKPAR